MQDILIKAGCFVAIIILGYTMKKIGVLHQDDFMVLSKIVIRITTPAAIAVSFAGKEIDLSLLLLILLGFGSGIVLVLAAYILGAGSSKNRRAFDMLNVAGYNIGNFALPFVQGFLGPTGIIVTSLFDTGNAVIALGGAYGAAATVKDGSGFDLKLIAGKLMRSVPFVCYIILVTLNLTKIAIPSPIVSCLQIIANANAFLAMFMLGVGFNLSGDFKQIGIIAKVLIIRYGLSALMAAGVYFLLPFDLEIRQTLVILFFSPISAIVPAFTGDMGEDVGLSSAINSISIICSIVIIVTLLSVML